MMAMFFFFTIIVFWQWISRSGIQTNQATCTAKLLNFCTRWYKYGFADDKKPDWDAIKPENCEEVGISEPDAETCKNLI